MVNNIIGVFKKFLQKNKWFNLISFYLFFHNVIFFLLIYLIKLIYKDESAIDLSIVFVLIFMEILTVFSISSLAEILKVNDIFLTVMIYSVVWFSIGRIFLKRIIENEIDLEEQKKYKIICYSMVFFIYIILNFINFTFLRFINNR